MGMIRHVTRLVGEHDDALGLDFRKTVGANKRLGAAVKVLQVNGRHILKYHDSRYCKTQAIFISVTTWRRMARSQLQRFVVLRIIGVERRHAAPELVSSGSLGGVLCPAVLHERNHSSSGAGSSPGNGWMIAYAHGLRYLNKTLLQLERVFGFI